MDAPTCVQAACMQCLIREVAVNAAVCSQGGQGWLVDMHGPLVPWLALSPMHGCRMLVQAGVGSVPARAGLVAPQSTQGTAVKALLVMHGRVCMLQLL